MRPQSRPIVRKLPPCMLVHFSECWRPTKRGRIISVQRPPTAYLLPVVARTGIRHFPSAGQLLTKYITRRRGGRQNLRWRGIRHSLRLLNEKATTAARIMARQGVQGSSFDPRARVASDEAARAIRTPMRDIALVHPRNFGGPRSYLHLPSEQVSESPVPGLDTARAPS